MTQRLAVYCAPSPDTALWQAGSAWLGRDARAGQPIGTAPAGRVQPWRYGFHATLKAPLRLRDGATEALWLDAVAAVARAHRRFTLPSLQVALLSDFIALRPVDDVAPASPLRRLADHCVEALDAFRTPLDGVERARRLAALAPAEACTPRQSAAIERWGYPHVFDDWRFHFTLSDPLPPGEARQGLLHEARRHFAGALVEPVCCDALSVFVEAAPGQPFQLAWRFDLAPV